MKAIYRVTERNVDGCGGDATEFVSFSRSLSIKETMAFQKALDEAKKNSGEDADTASMIEDALKAFGLKDGQLCGAPYDGAFEF